VILLIHVRAAQTHRPGVSLMPSTASSGMIYSHSESHVSPKVTQYGHL
jgi:hypothetical protein